MKRAATASLLLTIASWLLSCGGEDVSAPPEGLGKKQECRSPEGGVGRDRNTVEVPFAKPFKVDLTGAAPAGELLLELEGARVVRTISDEFADKGLYTPAPGHRFIVLTIGLKNLGKKEIEAANSIGNVFVVQNREGKSWLRVDRDKDCTTASPSQANAVGLESPEAEVKPGKGYETVLVYSIPSGSKATIWYGARRAVRFGRRAQRQAERR